MRENKDWIITAMGRRVDLHKPNTLQFHIEDIAAGLSKTCRFGGHCSLFFSVAEHCYRMSAFFDTPRQRMQALLHDAAEAYIGDIIHPFKRKLFVKTQASASAPFRNTALYFEDADLQQYQSLVDWEAQWLEAIFSALHLESLWPIDLEVQEMDVYAYAAEARALQANSKWIERRIASLGLDPERIPDYTNMPLGATPSLADEVFRCTYHRLLSEMRG